MKRWMKVVISLVVLLVGVVVALLLLVNANTFRPILEKQLTAALGRQVTLGNLTFSPFSGSLAANNLIIAGDPAYSAAPFLTAKQLQIGVELRSLIFSRQLIVRSFEVESPEIHLVQGTDGSWNFSTIGRSVASRTADSPEESAFPDLTVGQIVIRHGRAIVQSMLDNGPARVYDDLNLSVLQFSFVKPFSFTLRARLPGDGELSASGNAGPINQQDASMTAVEMQISVKHLEPVVAGFLDPKIGVSVLADIDAHAMADGQTVHSVGTVHMQHLQLVKGGSPVSKPVDLRYDVTQDLRNDSGQLKNAEINVGKVAMHVNGTYQLIPEDPQVKLQLTGRALPMDELQALMSSVGVKLPNGAVLQNGTLTFALAVSGPANNLVIAGPVAVDNTRLVGFDLGSKIAGIAALGGVKTGDTTEIQTLRFDLRATNAGIQTDNVYSIMPAMGVATGSGTVSPAGVLNYRLVVQVTSAKGMGKAGVGLLTKLNGAADSTAKNQTVKGVPMLVTGTATNPVITTDVRGLMRRNAAAVAGKLRHGPGNVLQRLFGKKK